MQHLLEVNEKKNDIIRKDLREIFKNQPMRKIKKTDDALEIGNSKLKLENNIEKPAGFREFANLVEAKDWVKEKFSPWSKSISLEEAVSICQYTTYTYKAINKGLRQNKDMTKTGHKKDYLNMCSALDKSVIPENIVVFRGMTGSGLGDLAELQPKEMIGKVMHDKAFISTTLFKYVGEQLTTGMFDIFSSLKACFCGAPKFPPYLQNGVLLKIKVPKGTKGAYVSNLSKFPNELEILINKNQKMIITDVQEKNRYLEIECEIIK